MIIICVENECECMGPISLVGAKRAALTSVSIRFLSVHCSPCCIEPWSSTVDIVSGGKEIVPVAKLDGNETSKLYWLQNLP